MLHHHLIGVVLAFVALLAIGCSEEPPPPGPLEVGLRASTGEFEAFAPGADFVLQLLGGRILGLEVSLRMPRLDTTDPDVEIAVVDEGLVIGANLTDMRPYDLELQGDDHILWDAPTTFQVDPCCFLCRDVTIEARVVDASGHRREGSVMGRVSRGACPDPGACCAAAEDCPMPERTRLCM